MINLTKEQIEETLIRFKSYSHWLFHSEDGVKSFQLFSRTFKGKTFKLDINKYGKIVSTCDGFKCEYSVCVITKNQKSDLLYQKFDVLEFLCSFDTEEFNNLNEDYKCYFREIVPFVLSLFQRMISFSFFSLMHEDTIGTISDDLLSCNIITNEK